MTIITGGSGDDNLKGTNGADVISGGAGDDFLQGKAGADYIDGGQGDDQIQGNEGDDYIIGGQGDDFIHGGIGTDTAAYSGSVKDYSYHRDGENFYISHSGGTGLDGDDRLISIERLIFADAVIDLTQNNAPIAFNDTASTDEDNSVSGNVLSNDFDWEGDAMTATPGTFTGVYGTLVLNANGSYTYTPNASAQSLAQGQVVQDTFTYTVTDGSLSDTGTLTINVSGNNDAPVANSDVSSTGENNSVLVNVLANDTDVDNGAVLTVIAASAPAGQGSAAVVGNQVQFNPGTDFDYLDTGETAIVVVSYTIKDEHGATSSSTVSITVNGANDAPVANDDTASTTEDASVSGNVLANDTDVDVELLTVTTPGTYVGANGTLVLAANGSYTYTPNAATQALDDGESVGDVFTYTASDGTASDTATLSVTVNGANDAPVANDDIASTNEDSGGVSGNVLTNDTDVDVEPLTVATPGTYVGTYGTLVLAANGSYTYTPGAAAQGLDVGETAQDVFTYSASDGTASDTATLTVTVTGLNDPPVANDDTNATDENTPVSGNVLTNDTDVDGETLTVVNAATFIGAYGTLVLAANGSYTYTPGAGAAALTNGQTADDIFTYIASDGTASDTATLTITVTGLSGVPNAIDDTASTTEDAAVSGNVLTNDTDPENDPLTVSDPGTYVGTYGTLVLNANGSYTYTPNAAADGLAVGESAQDVFSYTATDGGASDTANLTVTVNGTNDAPTIDGGGTDDSGSVTELPDGDPNENVTVHSDSGAVAFDDLDLSDTHSASFTPQGGPYLGTFSLDPVDQGGDSVGWDFTVSDAALEGLAEGEIRIQTYEVEIDDGHGGTATQLVTITINGAGVGSGPQSVWYIDNTAVGSTNVGTAANPYTSIAAFNAAQGTLGGPQTGHTVHLLAGTGTGIYAEADGINLLNGQILVGDATGPVRPTITATAGDGINVAQNNNVSGIDIGNTSGADISDSGGTVGNLTITDVGSSGTGRIIDVDQGGTLNVTLNSAESLSSTGGAIDLNLVGGSFTVTGATSIAGAAGGGVDVTASAGLDLDFQGDLTIATTSTTGLNVQNAGSLTVGGAVNSITSTSGIAVSLGTISGVSLSNATISSASNYAILGNGVADFTLSDSIVTGGAASAAVIGFTGLTGTADLLGNSISGGNDNLSVLNSSGSLVLTIADSVDNQAVIGLTALNGNDGVRVETNGTASVTMLIDGVDFSGARGDLLQTVAGGTSTQLITVQDSNFNNVHANTTSGGGGVNIGGGGGAGSNIIVDYIVTGSTFTGADGNALTAVFTPTAGAIRGHIADNVVGVNDGISGTEGSANFGDGIVVGLEKQGASGTATHSVTIVDNEVYDVYGGLGGIVVRGSGGTAAGQSLMEATIDGNVVEEMGEFALGAFYGVAGDFAEVGLNMTDNVFDASGALFGWNAVYLDQFSSDAHYNFPGYTGSADGENNGGTASVDLDAFLSGQGNVMTNGGFPTFPGGGVDASFALGITGDPLTLAPWFG